MADSRSQELETLCAEIAQWRAKTGGGRGHRIPKELWQRVVAVARVEGCYKVEQATRLKADRIKAFMDEADLASAVHLPASAASMPFVALQMTGATARGSAISVELQSRSGEVMRIESTDSLDLPALVAAFWSRST